jgi:hypothetical protein
MPTVFGKHCKDAVLLAAPMQRDFLLFYWLNWYIKLFKKLAFVAGLANHAV